MAFIYNLADTWNDAGVTYTSIKMNVTDSASNANSLLMDLQIGGVSRFNVQKNGAVNTGGVLTVSGSAQINGNVNLQGVANNINWGGLIVLTGDATDILAQRRGVNAQASRIYNTYTDASNYERGFFRYVSNVLEIGHEAAGTGTTGRDIRFITQGFTAMTLNGASLTMNVAFQFVNVAQISTTGFRAASNIPYGWVVGSNPAVSPDTTLVRTAAAIVGVRGAAATDGAALSLIEQTAPAAPATNGVYIYAEDNGSGKTRLMARFATGAAVQLAVEP